MRYQLNVKTKHATVFIHADGPQKAVDEFVRMRDEFLSRVPHVADGRCTIEASPELIDLLKTFAQLASVSDIYAPEQI